MRKRDCRNVISFYFLLLKGGFAIMKVFLSHPMNNIPYDEIFRIRNDAISKISKLYPDTEIEIIDNYTHLNAPKNAGRLYHLGISIGQMEEADIIYFCKGWTKAKGCQIEYRVADLYGLKILNEDLSTIGDLWIKKPE